MKNRFFEALDAYYSIEWNFAKYDVEELLCERFAEVRCAYEEIKNSDEMSLGIENLFMKAQEDYEESCMDL